MQSQDPVLNEAAARLGVCLRVSEDQLMRDELVASSAMINATSGANGDVPTEVTRQDVDLVVRTLRNNMAESFLSGVEGENRFGTAPRIACGGFKPLVIDLELLAA